MRGECRLDRRDQVGTTVPVGRVGQREVCALLVDGHEAAGAVERLGPGRKGAQDAVAPGLGQAVPVDRVGCGRGRRTGSRLRQGGPLGGGIGPRRHRVGDRSGGLGRLRRCAGGLLAPPHGADGGTPAHVRRRGSRPLRPALGVARVDGPPVHCRRPTSARPAAPGRGNAAPPKIARSSRLTRSDSASIPESRSGRTARTTAISSTTCAVGCLADVDQRVAEDLDAADDTRQSHLLGQGGERLRSDDPDVAHSSEASAERNTWRRSSMSSVASCWGPQPPATSALRATRTRPTSPSASASSTRASSGRAASADPAAGHLVQSRQRIVGRAPPAADGGLEGVGVETQRRLLVDGLDQAVQRLCSQQAELEVLGAAADRRGHLLRVGGGEDEDDVARGPPSVFNSAFAAAVESMWTSSTM